MIPIHEKHKQQECGGDVKHSLFGWNMVLLNLTTGALFGYSSENSRVSLKVPATTVQAVFEPNSCTMSEALAVASH